MYSIHNKQFGVMRSEQRFKNESLEKKGGVMELTSRQREIFNLIRTFNKERG
jgi:hypothetical protein